jgi:hypothetical protein
MALSECGFTATLNGVTIDGTATDGYIMLTPGPSGLGSPNVKNKGLPLADRHGSVAGPDFMGTRRIRIPVAVYVEDDPEGAMSAWRSLQNAWSPAASDQALTISSPGLTGTGDSLTYYGRPRGATQPNFRSLHAGVVYALATFEALDPVGYTSGGTTVGSGGFTVENGGDTATTRATITLSGNDSAPKIENTTDSGGYVEFANVLATGETWTIDMAAKTVIDSGGNDVLNASGLTAASPWFSFLVGSNSLGLTGATQASVTLLDGWQ